MANEHGPNKEINGVPSSVGIPVEEPLILIKGGEDMSNINSLLFIIDRQGKGEGDSNKKK